MKRIDHAEASSKFIRAKDRRFHDRRLWDLRQKRDQRSEHLAEWEGCARLPPRSGTRSPTSPSMEEFERNAIKNGAHVHWARDAEHSQVVFDILSCTARTLVKSSRC
jgi:L-lactate dehydrogenase complex protein LldF